LTHLIGPNLTPSISNQPTNKHTALEALAEAFEVRSALLLPEGPDGDNDDASDQREEVKAATTIGGSGGAPKG
jgi:hypothetical protein